MPIIDNLEILGEIARGLGTEATRTNRGAVFFAGRDQSNNLVVVTAERINAAVEVCEVALTKPKGDPRIIGFVNGTIQKTPDGDIIMSDPEKRTNFTIEHTSGIAAFISAPR
ncbi:hypothetical protein HYU95_03180 [Candidatus Daviesbacteria bacterium]|nr:hypothetical protein [Candidatus Daviesbacteria bacterium]